MNTEQTRLDNATAHVFARRDAVFNHAKFGTPLPKDFIYLPQGVNPPIRRVSARPGADVGRVPAQARHNKFNTRRLLFAGAAVLGSIGAGAIVANRIGNLNSQESDLATAGDVNTDPTVTIHAGESGAPTSIDGMIAKVDPGVSVNSATYEAVHSDVTAQLPDLQSPDNLAHGQKFEIPEVPGASQNQANR